MPTFRPFAAVRPRQDIAEKLSCLPYDVMNRKEAAEMAKGDSHSFLHVVRSDIDFSDDVDEHNEKVYEKASQNLVKMQEEGILIKDPKPQYYIYRQTMDGRSQTGLVGCVAVDDYLDETIKKHEHTRVEKEIDRIKHFYYCNANTEPVFLTYKADSRLKEIVEEWTRSNEPVYDFVSGDRFGHTVWVVSDERVIQEIGARFEQVGSLYIADGHHRSASASKVAMRRRDEVFQFTGREEFNFFMAVCFPDEQLYIMDYNRLVKDLNGNTSEAFLSSLRGHFEVQKQGAAVYAPVQAHEFGMYLEGEWYSLKARPGTFDEQDSIKRLDCTILQDNLLAPALGITDPRMDDRIDFVGGIRGLDELQRRVDSGEMKVAFALYPVAIGDLIAVADSGRIMPPKSTWFEPKLRSGLFIHSLDDDA